MPCTYRLQYCHDCTIVLYYSTPCNILRRKLTLRYTIQSTLNFIKYNQLKIDDLCKLNIGTFMYKYCITWCLQHLTYCLKLILKIIAIIIDLQLILIFLIISLNLARNQFLIIKVSKFGMVYLKTLKNTSKGCLIIIIIIIIIGFTMYIVHFQLDQSAVAYYYYPVRKS